MEHEVAGTGAGPRLYRAQVGRRESAGCGVEAKYEDPVEPLVRHQHEATRRVEHDIVRMGTRLLDLVRTGVARQLHQLMLVPERSVRRDRQNCNASTRIIGHDKEFTRRVDGLSHAVLAASRSAIEKLGVAGL